MPTVQIVKYGEVQYTSLTLVLNLCYLYYLAVHHSDVLTASMASREVSLAIMTTDWTELVSIAVTCCVTNRLETRQSEILYITC